MYKKFAMMFLLLAAILSGCTANSEPVQVVATYLQALSQKNSAQISSVSCSDWEATALMELDSFQAVSTTLEGLDCQLAEAIEDNRAVVNCNGKLIASYNGEIQEFDLSVRSYIVENSGGEWLVCGTK